VTSNAIRFPQLKSLLHVMVLACAAAGCTGEIDSASTGATGADAGPAQEIPPGEDPPVTPPGDPGEDPDSPPESPAPAMTLSFEESGDELVNPERGYYVGLDLANGGNADHVRSGGHSLAIAIVRLDAYKHSSIDSAFLDKLTAGFADVRAAGIKVILRFTYNASLTSDASRERILGHIQQLAPILQANADVISVMQAGFIGAWGEWHSSTNGLDNDTDRAAILNALLTALPASRTVAVRTPMFKEAAFPGGPLDADEAFSGSARARISHHNDCFLASASDLGTYASPVDEWQDYVAQDGEFTAIGGETCAVAAPRTECASAVSEMEDKHWSYLNEEYNQSVLAGFESGGCDGEIKQRLGYRFAFERAVLTSKVAPGGALSLEIDVVNRGFSAPFNKRPVYVTVAGAGVRHTVRLEGVDARRWRAGETTTIQANLRLPADLASGNYTVALWLPDESSNLRADPRYAIRLANDGVWVDGTGDNVITTELQVDPSAPGAVDPTATALVELR
jgi:uncharacterized protein DUF4832/uncharacterized protein DUF4874